MTQWLSALRSEGNIFIVLGLSPWLSAFSRHLEIFFYAPPITLTDEFIRRTTEHLEFDFPSTFDISLRCPNVQMSRCHRLVSPKIQERLAIMLLNVYSTKPRALHEIIEKSQG